jgi:hypothetical protein
MVNPDGQLIGLCAKYLVTHMLDLNVLSFLNSGDWNNNPDLDVLIREHPTLSRYILTLLKNYQSQGYMPSDLYDTFVWLHVNLQELNNLSTTEARLAYLTNLSEQVSNDFILVSQPDEINRRLDLIKQLEAELFQEEKRDVIIPEDIVKITLHMAGGEEFKYTDPNEEAVNNFLNEIPKLYEQGYSMKQFMGHNTLSEIYKNLNNRDIWWLQPPYPTLQERVEKIFSELEENDITRLNSYCNILAKNRMIFQDFENGTGSGWLLLNPEERKWIKRKYAYFKSDEYVSGRIQEIFDIWQDTFKESLLRRVVILVANGIDFQSMLQGRDADFLVDFNAIRHNPEAVSEIQETFTIKQQKYIDEFLQAVVQIANIRPEITFQEFINGSTRYAFPRDLVNNILYLYSIVAQFSNYHIAVRTQIESIYTEARNIFIQNFLQQVFQNREKIFSFYQNIQPFEMRKQIYTDRIGFDFDLDEIYSRIKKLPEITQVREDIYKIWLNQFHSVPEERTSRVLSFVYPYY